MEKYIYNFCIVCLLSLGFFSCEDSTEDVSKITYFASLNLKGKDALSLNVGDTYVEPGYEATEGEEDITSKVLVSGSTDTTKTGVYTITYSVANIDGFPVSKTRLVLVASPTFASAYFGKSEYGTELYDNSPVIITKLEDGSYQIDDITGGLYWNGRYPGYEASGYDFHLEATFTLNIDNTISNVKMGDWYFSSKPSFKSGILDPETGTVTITLDNGGKPIVITLTK